MTLPDLTWQIVYGRLAWTLVLAALLVSFWPRNRRVSHAALGAVVGGVGLLMLLPGEASPAYTLGLAFQFPSGLLAGLCALSLAARWQGRAPAPFLPAPLAAALAIAGAALYLDAIGWLAQGYYYAGFGPLGAPVLALLGIAACALAFVRKRGGRHHLVLLGALLLFSLARLPTGNLWDALLDPLLWIWALASLARRAVRRLARKTPQHAGAPDGVPEPVPAFPVTGSVAGSAALADNFSISKE